MTAATTPEHMFALEFDTHGRARWVCACGDVGRFRARRPYLAWRDRRCGRLALRAVRTSRRA